jgi:hypothetical protein
MEDVRVPIADVAGPLAAFFDQAETLASEIQNQIPTGWLDYTILSDLQQFGECYLSLMLSVNASLTERSRMFASMMEFFTELSKDDKTDDSA